MLTRRSPRRAGTAATRRAALLLLFLPLLVTGLTAPAAAADAPCGRVGCPAEGGGDAVDGSAGSGAISVTVRGTAVRGGGESTSIPARTVRHAPVCWYSRFMSGREYADAWGPDGVFTGLNGGIPGMSHLPEEDRFAPWDGYLAHAEDDDGAWYTPTCSTANWTGETSDWADYQRDYHARNDPVYVEVGEVPPQADVPPEVLAEIAYDAMDLPVGTLRWNPTRQGGQATFVGLDTWVWVEDALTEVSVTASVSTGTSATVTARLESLTVGAPGADTATCAGAGVAWSESADASAACRVVFHRSSANQPVKSGFSVPTATMTATASWTASWTSNLDPAPTELAAQEITGTAEVPVAEVQSLVTG